MPDDAPGDFNVNLGNTATTSSSGGGTSTPVDPLRPYRDWLLGVRIDPGPFVELMHKAASGNWTVNEFTWALETDKAFQRMFPGISTLLSGGMNVPGAIAAWRNMSQEYIGWARDSGYGHLVELTPKRVGMLIEGGVDKNEFVFKLGMLDALKNNPQFGEAFNAMLTARGEKKLDDVGLFKYLVGKADQRLYDLYEGALILQQMGPEGMRVGQARRFSRMISGGEGPAFGPGFSIGDFAASVQGIYAALGHQQISDAGLRAKDIALVALKDRISSPEARKKAEAALSLLEQLFRNARAKNTDLQATTLLAGRPISESAPQGEFAS